MVAFVEWQWERAAFSFFLPQKILHRQTSVPPLLPGNQQPVPGPGPGPGAGPGPGPNAQLNPQNTPASQPQPMVRACSTHGLCSTGGQCQLQLSQLGTRCLGLSLSCSVSPGQGGMHVNGAPPLMQPPMQGGVPAPGQMAAPVQGPGPGPMAPGGEFGPSCPSREHTGPAHTPLCLPHSQRARPHESTWNPVPCVVLVLLPELGCTVGLSLGGANTKGIDLQMLPQELAEKVFGARGMG